MLTGLNHEVRSEQSVAMYLNSGLSTESSLPRHPSVGVLALVPDTWGKGTWMSRQHVLTRLAAYFPVVWVDPAPGWREALAHIAARRDENNVVGTPSAFQIHTAEWWLPRLHRPAWLSRLVFRRRLHRARDRLVRRGCERIILYIWRPQFAEALELVPHDLSCYHIDDEYSFLRVDRPVEASELHLIKRVHQVFLHSPALVAKKGEFNPNSLYVPNGVDYHAFARAWPEPPDLAAVPHPRLGYSGVLKRQLDWPLLEDLASRHPEWSFVFVGGAAQHLELAEIVDAMGRLPNVYFLGRKSLREVPAYPQYFDVCLMPYHVDGYTKYIYPLKLHEYFAAGRPVVGSAIQSLEDFADLLALPRSRDEWSRAVADALRPEANTAESVAARRAVARQHDWSVLVQRIAGALAQRLEEEVPPTPPF